MNHQKTNPNPLVLLVDDEPDLLDILAEEMREAGHNTLTASSGNKAISLLKEANVDVIVSDVRMPDGSGIDLLQMVRSLAADRPSVIFITGYSDRRIDELFEMGAEAVFTKPLNLKTLRDTVAECAATKQLNAQRMKQRVEGDFKAVFSASHLKSHEVDIGNLSLTGAFFTTRDPRLLPGVGVHVDFAITSSFSRNLRVTGNGVVRWQRPAPEGDRPIGFGLEFLVLDEESRRALAILVNDAKTKSIVPGQQR